MNRLAPLLLLPVMAFAGCTESVAAPDAPGDGYQNSASAQAIDSTPDLTPAPLPTIPTTLPNEVIRGTFSSGGVESGTATHTFSGQAVSVHVLCTSYEGVVEVALMLDGEQEMTNTSACETPHFIIEDDSFEAGTHEVTFEISPTGGAEGVVYLVEGDI